VNEHDIVIVVSPGLDAPIGTRGTVVHIHPDGTPIVEYRLEGESRPRVEEIALEHLIVQVPDPTYGFKTWKLASSLKGEN
jgi:hypothetical protein